MSEVWLIRQLISRVIESRTKQSVTSVGMGNGLLRRPDFIGVPRNDRYDYGTTGGTMSIADLRDLSVIIMGILGLLFLAASIIIAFRVYQQIKKAQLALKKAFDRVEVASRRIVWNYARPVVGIIATVQGVWAGIQVFRKPPQRTGKVSARS